MSPVIPPPRRRGPPDPAGRRPRRGLWLATVLVALPGCALLDDPPDEEAPAPFPVETLVVHPRTFEERVETTGSVEAPEDVILTAQAGGTVIRLVPEGTEVGQGDIVAQLDPRLAEAGLERARGSVADARAALAQAEREYGRREPLARDEIIPPGEMERLLTQVEQARARLDQAMAQEREAEQQLERTRVRAPFDGTVESRIVRVGEQVVAGQEVVRVIGDERVEASAGIPERFAGDVRVGSPASVSFQAYGLDDREAEVAFVSRAVDPRSRTFRIRIDLDHPLGLRTGMIARVTVVRRVIPDALVLPLEIVLADERMRSVLVVEPLEKLDSETEAPLGRVEIRAILPGPRHGADVVVEDGLLPGDEVIVTGQDQVAPGDTVAVVERYRDLEAFRRAVVVDGAGP